MSLLPAASFSFIEVTGRITQSIVELYGKLHKLYNFRNSIIIVNPPGIPKASVLLYHGWASKNENYLFLASLISSWGFKVIVPELPYHGVRGSLNYFDTKVLQENFWNVVLQGAKEVEEIVSALSESDNNISIIGHSAGGFIAGGAFSNVSVCNQLYY